MTNHPGQLSLAIPPWVSAMSSEYQPKGRNAPWPESKGRYMYNAVIK